MKLEEAKEYLPFIIRDLEASYYNRNFTNALKVIKRELKNLIPKKEIEDLIEEVYTDDGIGYELDKDEKLGAIRALKQLLEKTNE